MRRLCLFPENCNRTVKLTSSRRVAVSHNATRPILKPCSYPNQWPLRQEIALFWSDLEIVTDTLVLLQLYSSRMQKLDAISVGSELLRQLLHAFQRKFTEHESAIESVWHITSIIEEYIFLSPTITSQFSCDVCSVNNTKEICKCRQRSRFFVSEIVILAVPP